MSLENAKMQTCSGGSSTFERFVDKIFTAFWHHMKTSPELLMSSVQTGAARLHISFYIRGGRAKALPAVQWWTTQRNVTEKDLNIHMCSRATISNAVDISCSWPGGGDMAFFPVKRTTFFLSRRESWVTLCLQTSSCPHSSRPAAHANCCQCYSGQNGTTSYFILMKHYTRRRKWIDKNSYYLCFSDLCITANGLLIKRKKVIIKMQIKLK